MFEKWHVTEDEMVDSIFSTEWNVIYPQFNGVTTAQAAQLTGQA
jgi:hypothetical protein